MITSEALLRLSMGAWVFLEWLNPNDAARVKCGWHQCLPPSVLQGCPMLIAYQIDGDQNLARNQH
ncbi:MULTISPECIES: hypothetical protein [Oscillatoriales]|uniref:hypothetical protein n=1 Tax=Limnospira TaxID=2596745 RepID=UPI000AACE687|nr:MULTISPECIES: hypothetical protein [unclassified Limnospira]